MNTIVIFAALATLAMVTAIPLQEDQKNNLQSLLDSLSDQTEAKELKADMQQVGGDDGSKAEAQFRRKLKTLGKIIGLAHRFWQAKEQQNDEDKAISQFLRLHVWANKQDVGDDDGSQATAQFLGGLWANKQDVGDDYGSPAEAQFFQHMARFLFG